MVIERISKFNDEDVTRFLEVYKYEMANRGATGVQMVLHINRICTLDVRARLLSWHAWLKIMPNNRWSSGR